ncbi:acyl-CoA dehydrogenase family protein [Streptomyces sp. 11x1]|uniref:acyl-CoA dehydrogenase family protein n=1 Tax=Streptomyces sp. 11x1 TaxID=3038642 RepID=UPI00292E7D7C|nr:acyl-CoA dehydrogenase family protein [Streptomyces sp. 11x1]WNZ12909.1 acyl-CoA dehydrogenase family protein [Streptomyces sp. 11x1]
MGEKSAFLDREVQELIDRATELIPKLADIGNRSDRLSEDPTAAMRLLNDAGFWRLQVPAAYGGLGDGRIGFGLESLYKIYLSIGRGDAAVLLNTIVGSVALAEFFSSDFPQATKRQVAEEIATGRRFRFVASGSETGVTTGPTTARKVDGGVMVNGTKSFNSNSGSAAESYASVSAQLEGSTSLVTSLIPLDDPAVRLHGDWDVMGMRGTQSQRITYDDVFVPDGWYTVQAARDPLLFPLAQAGQAMIVLGPAYGALDAAIDYVKASTTPTVKIYDSIQVDPFVRRRIGEFRIKLDSARALLMELVRTMENADETTDMAQLMIDALSAKTAATSIAVEVASGIVDLTGTRSAAAKYNIDRFWRNIRTFSQHDPKVDAAQYFVGGYHLAGEVPGMEVYVRV